MAQAREILEAHGHWTLTQGDELWVLETYGSDGQFYSTWILAPTTRRDLYNWLGY